MIVAVPSTITNLACVSHTGEYREPQARISYYGPGLAVPALGQKEVKISKKYSTIKNQIFLP